MYEVKPTFLLFDIPAFLVSQ